MSIKNDEGRVIDFEKELVQVKAVRQLVKIAKFERNNKEKITNLQQIQLSLFNCELENDNVDYLVSFLEKVQRCENITIELSCFSLKCSDFINIISVVKQIDGLKNLQLGFGQNQIENSAIFFLFDSIQSLSTLSQITLFLYGLDIKSSQVIHLSKALSQISSNLTVLNLRLEYNQITDEGIIALSQTIQQQNLLQKVELGLKGNCLTEKGYNSLFNSLLTCSQNLTTLYISMNVKHQNAEQNNELIQINSSQLKQIHLCFYQSQIRYFLNIDQLQQIEEATLIFDQTQIIEKGFQQISQFNSACSKSQYFKNLNLETYCSIPKLEFEQIQCNISSCIQLENLSLRLRVYENCEEVEFLNCINFSKLNLKSLNIFYEFCTNINSIKLLPESIVSQQNIKNLKLQTIPLDRFNLIKQELLHPIFNYIQKLNNIQEICLSFKAFNLGEQSGNIIGQSLILCQNIQSIDLDLSDNNLNEVEVKQMIDHFSQLLQLKRLKLQLQNNQLINQNLISEVFQGVSQLINLTYFYLILNANLDTTESNLFLGIVRCLQNLQQLSYLHISFFDYEVTNYQQLVNIIKKIPKLVEFLLFV